jgi:flagellar motility protein MotE (MotC chaperone)
MNNTDSKRNNPDSPLLGFYFSLVAQRQKLRSDIRLKLEQIRALEMELKTLDQELEGHANKILAEKRRAEK